MDRFQCIQAFVRVAETKSFVEAARQLHVTASVITSRVKQLEDYLQTPLFHRSTRAVTLSEAGGNFFEECSDIVSRMDSLMERMRLSLTPSSAFSALLEAKNFAERLPGRFSRILDAVANQEMKVRVELIDEGAVLDGLQKVANRITLGVILAAMIIGAAMLMRVETTWRILGYPGLAMLFFLAAAFGGGWMAISIIRHDHARGRRPAP